MSDKFFIKVENISTHSGKRYIVKNVPASNKVAAKLLMNVAVKRYPKSIITMNRMYHDNDWFGPGYNAVRVMKIYRP